MKFDNENLKLIHKAISENALRMTRKREMLLGALIDMERPVPASTLRDRAGLPESDLVTVYRTLEAFESIGIIQRIPLEQTGCLFELTRPNDHFHHFVCRKCHSTTRLNMCFADNLEEQAKKLGFTQITHVLEVYGFCEACQTRSH